MFMYRSSQKLLRWALCVYPTPSAAKECGMSLNEYTNFVSHACGLHLENPITHWLEVHQNQQRIVDFLNRRNKIRFVGPNGTDITFSADERIWINSDGHRNMPSGEVFTSPIEDSAEGQIYFSYPTIHEGQDVEGVTLRYEKGLLVEWHAKIGQSALDDAFSIEGSRRVGEIAIGTNKHIQRGTKNILFDEKIAGSIHMAVGASYPETGGLNQSALHWDLITDMRHGGQIYSDGKLIYENGHFLGDLA
jgi:aminopeptidase